MDFTELAFKRIDGSWIKTLDYVDWANELLEGGCDAPSIWELAVCRWDDYVDSDQVERLFQSSINELRLELPSDWYSALCTYSSSICQKMLQGLLMPWECVQEMLTISDDYNEPYIHWIWLDLVNDLDPAKAQTDCIKFNGALDLNKPEECIQTVAQQFVFLCSVSLPERFPWIWRCEMCQALSEENTFTQTKTCTCTRCGGIVTMKNMRFFENRAALVKSLDGGEKVGEKC
ncbi:hypothetical protein [Janthinobacterium sp. PAMC25594]|uniref:hypothetical protein n=1 Tax=Janthinobacterium sp. PAMC25594 TaxID=2861284 RepID=UPI001C6274B7|nr:hypothetical protein [Janthinobacterium sp. PAMC25594]QYG08433.1 hypothetical protein KY494_06515 [Janthinobacterium sp. PAMC25594]